MQVGNIRTGDKGIYVGRPSPLGNLWRITKTESREQVIERYRGWLFEQIMSSDPKVIDALSKLNEDDTLVCWCAPLACHASVIIDAWHWAKGHGLLHVPV